MKKLIEYFSGNHLLANVVFFGMILLSVFTWQNIGKEEMPEFAANWIRINTIYPGAPAEDVELFVTKPIEDELRSVEGLEEVFSTSSVGVSSFRITLDDDYPNQDEVIREIKDAVLRAELPSEVRDLPRFRQFRSSSKAILDIGLYLKGAKFLDPKERSKLQKYVLSFENQLLALPEVSSVERSHYRKPELQILVDPSKKHGLEFSLSEIREQISNNNLRAPIGSIRDRGESMVTALNELESVESLEKLILRGNYEGQGVRLGDVAQIREGFARANSIFKINGHEGVFLNIKKSISTDILSAQKAVMKFIKEFQYANKGAPIGIVLMDDESYAVTNRLNIINSNGLLGFFLIVLVLLIFLDAKSGFWVAMGIPFSMGFTLIIAFMAGYTVNNMTLAAIIIVLGIVVDDAIIIAENISRYREEGLPLDQAAIVGTIEVFKPILASIITTCVAFTPLLFFEGFFGKFVSYIPLVIALMLAGSLIESIFILPAHMAGRTIILDRFSLAPKQKNWFHRYEKKYESFLLKVFKFRTPVLIGFMILLIGAIALYQNKMKFVMFPREESQEVFIKVKATKGSPREETARLIGPLEEMLTQQKEAVVGVRSSIGVSRFGGAVKENEASILVELLPPDERKVPLDQLLANWKDYAKKLPGIEEARFHRSRWGRGSGHAIELQVQENDDEKRDHIVKELVASMGKAKGLKDIEADKPLLKKEFLVQIKQDNLIKYDVTPAKITSTLRSFVEGSILYSLNKGDEEVDVRLSVPNSSKANLEEFLKLRIETKNGQLAYLSNMVEIKEVSRAVNIPRTNYKRSTMIYADLDKKLDITPLEIAEQLERDVFPRIINQYPTSILKFRGEIEDTREGQGNFKNSVYIVVVLIYLILIIMFNSLSKPLLVLSVVPFGLAGVIFVLMAHGMNVYGFFALIGALGMIGVVINDAIVMIDKMEKRKRASSLGHFELIAQVASTRLRPILVTTITTVVGILPTAYGFAGYDSMLAEMMLTMGWGLAFGTCITLILIPCLYTFVKEN